jgi:hypothetical protein
MLRDECKWQAWSAARSAAAGGGWKLCSMRYGALPLPAFQSPRIHPTAPPRIRQSRSCHRREQSVARSGVRHALLPPCGDGSFAPCRAELFLFPAFQSPRIHCSAPHPAKPELPLARAERRALRSAARFAAASGGWKLCSMRCGALPLSRVSVSTPSLLRPTSGRAGAAIGASKASRTPERRTLRIPPSATQVAFLHLGIRLEFCGWAFQQDLPSL